MGTIIYRPLSPDLLAGLTRDQCLRLQTHFHLGRSPLPETPPSFERSFYELQELGGGWIRSSAPAGKKGLQASWWDHVDAWRGKYEKIRDHAAEERGHEAAEILAKQALKDDKAVNALKQLIRKLPEAGHKIDRITKVLNDALLSDEPDRALSVLKSMISDSVGPHDPCINFALTLVIREKEKSFRNKKITDYFISIAPQYLQVMFELTQFAEKGGPGSQLIRDELLKLETLPPYECDKSLMESAVVRFFRGNHHPKFAEPPVQSQKLKKAGVIVIGKWSAMAAVAPSESPSPVIYQSEHPSDIYSKDELILAVKTFDPQRIIEALVRINAQLTDGKEGGDFRRTANPPTEGAPVRSPYAGLVERISTFVRDKGELEVMLGDGDSTLAIGVISKTPLRCGAWIKSPRGSVNLEWSLISRVRSLHSS